MSVVSPSPPALTFVTEIRAQVAPAIDAGAGRGGGRRIIPITGGAAKGPRLSGVILPGGADFQRVRPDDLTEIQARYIIETEVGERVYIENTGLRRAERDTMRRLAAGEIVNPDLVYFRSAPRFETSAPAFAWMERSIFVCSGARFPDHVRLAVFEVG